MSRRLNLILAVVLLGVGFLGATVGAVITATSVDDDATGQSTREDTREDRREDRDDRRGSRRSNSVDAMFIERMIPHHQDAIDMAELAATRAEHPELKELAANIAQTQSDENEQMREWYQDWYGEEVPDVSDRGFGMGGGMMMDDTDLEELEQAEDFDKEFIEQMIPHHRMAIMMAGMAGRGTSRDEMRDFTDNIIDTQSREIDQMRSWYREWYGN